MTTHPFMLPLLAVCLALSFLFSGMESGVFALSRLRIRRLMRTGHESARLLHEHLEHPENFLWTILVGNTFVNFVVFGWWFMTLHSQLAGRRVWLAVAYGAGIFLFYILFDLLPKMVFRAYPNRLCLLSAVPFRAVHFILRPLVALLEWCSKKLLKLRGGRVMTNRLFGNREELRQLMQESASALTSEERSMINKVFDLQNLTVRQFTTPLDQALTVDADAPMSSVMRLAREQGRWRFPVWETRDGQRRIGGLIRLDTLLFDENLDAGRRAQDYMQPALFLNEDSRLDEALGRMQRAGQRLALVLGPDRRERGLLTLEDILKTLFGEVKL